MCTDLFEAGEEPFKPERIANLCAIRKDDVVESATWLNIKVEAKLTIHTLTLIVVSRLRTLKLFAKRRGNPVHVDIEELSQHD